MRDRRQLEALVKLCSCLAEAMTCATIPIEIETCVREKPKREKEREIDGVERSPKSKKEKLSSEGEETE